jgi:hypothetical protein
MSDEKVGALRDRTEKLMQTFRMPRGLVVHLKGEAARAGRDLTANVIRWLEGVTSYFGLPEAAVALLEADRQRLGMERYEYLLHTLYQRSLLLRENGAGFDAPRRERILTSVDVVEQQAVVSEVT